MANRGDFNTVFPRSMKRLLSSTFIMDEHERGELRRMFIEAHNTHKAYKNRRADRKDVLADTSDE